MRPTTEGSGRTDRANIAAIVPMARDYNYELHDASFKQGRRKGRRQDDRAMGHKKGGKKLNETA
jgi:hypothetical protein